jgi:hypothetical protein
MMDYYYIFVYYIYRNMKGIEIKNGYKFNLGSAPDGSPYTSGWAYLGGRAGPGPNTRESFLVSLLFSHPSFL